MGNFLSSLNNKRRNNEMMELWNTINDIEKQFIYGRIDEKYIDEVIQTLKNISITSSTCTIQRDFILRLESIKRKGDTMNIN